MRFLLFFSLITIFLACRPKTDNAPQLTQSHVQFDFVEPDGTTTAIQSDDLIAMDFRAFPGLSNQNDPASETVRFTYDISFPLPDQANGNPQSVHIMFIREAVPVDLLRPSADSTKYVFADPQDWIAAFFEQDYEAGTDKVLFTLTWDNLALVSYGPTVQHNNSFQLTTANIQTLPSGDSWLSVSGTFNLDMDRWYPITGEGPWSAQNGAFHFTVNLAEYYED